MIGFCDDGDKSFSPCSQEENFYRKVNSRRKKWDRLETSHTNKMPVKKLFLKKSRQKWENNIQLSLR
jgi:hypothetical protein